MSSEHGEREEPELMSLEEAVETLKTSRSTVYRWLRNGQLRGVKVGRQWRVRTDDVERFLTGESPRIDAPPGVAKFLASLHALVGEEEEGVPEGEASMAAVIAMLRVALAEKASHLALEPHISTEGRVEGWLRIRSDGMLSTRASTDARSMPSLVEAWKTFAGCDVLKTTVAQTGRASVAVGDGKHIELHVTIVPSILGESVSVAIVDPTVQEMATNLDRFDFSSVDRDRIDRALAEPFGMIVVTGPTGSAKSTFLYACLKKLATPGLETISIEPMVELRIPGVLQIPVDASKGTTVASAIRAALRCDLDVLMVAEIPDTEALELVGPVALTGHLVLTALHAPDAISALVRMVEYGMEPHTAAEATRLVVSQRLVRKLCPECSVPKKLSKAELTRAKKAAREGGLDWDELPSRWRDAVGCASCGKSGYRGRRVIAETLEMSEELAEALRAKESEATLREIAIRNGLTTLTADGLRRAAAGETTLDEVWRVGGT